jgi:transcriptional regulator with XRE-family HTH domain
MIAMSANNGSNPATHFGRQMKKERLARGWSLREFAARTGIDFTTASRIENGKRPPTETAATACDTAFPERQGWFSEYYEEMRTWSEVPAAFRDWSELEGKAVSLRAWAPAIVHGLLQTEDYAAALLRTYPAVTEEAVTNRLAARMERQRRLYAREVLAWFVVDELSLYRLVGSHAVMAAQMRHLSAVAAMPNVTLQVLSPVGNPGVSSGFVIADDSAYAEHAASGFVYTGETFSALMRIFDSLRSESYRASESAALLERMAWAWTGGSPRIQVPTAGTA